MNTSELQQAVKMEYYVPEISDLFVGYELEFRTFVREDMAKDPVEVWQKITLDKSNFDSNRENWYNPFLSNIRTKFLDKSDIESLGWKIGYESPEFYEIFGEDAFGAYRILNKRDYSLRYSNKTRSLYLRFYAQDETWMNVYNGECKSINEFLKICKWLNIK